ncbi:hypothetical protein [Kribbella lupini]|uniref:Phage-related protein n=1 Tax=Kribbella lupini TaxID=291602 RepID=A0ABP4LCW5_9ACTN
MSDRPPAKVSEALVEGRRRTAPDRPAGDAVPPGLLALQRKAGNAAVSALMAAKLTSPGGDAASEIDAALVEIRNDEPAVDTVEKGLKAAKAAGVPVDLEGVKPPASALAVTKTGFGPGAVAPKKAVPPTKPVPAVSPLGKAAAKPVKAGGKGKGSGGGGGGVAPAAGGGGAAPAMAPLSGAQLLEPPAPPTGVRPEEDPAFTGVTGNVKGFAKAKRAHPPAASKAKEAQDAALAPTDDLSGQAKAAKADTMDAQQAGTFDKKAFIASVKTAIEAKSPKTLEEADEYKESGKAGEVKGELKGMVGQGKEGQAKDIETATAAPPDTSKGVAKPVTPMETEDPGQAAAIPAGGAAPKVAPPEQTNLEAGKHEATSEMAEAEVTDQQLAQSNEPQFQGALADKQTAAAHADTAPAAFRAQEQQVIEQNKTEAAAETKTGVAGMQGSKAAALAKLVADKGKAKSKDELKRAEVTTTIQNIFTAAEADVKVILDGIDPKVDAEFEQGEAKARAAFEGYVAAKMSAFKKDRYGGWLGGFRWAKDKLVGMPDKVNEFYDAGREIYLKQMDGVISRVADIVGGDLTAAKARIAKGRADIAAYVKSLPKDLQKIGSEASSEIGDKFEQLESDVDSKQDALVESLASKYTEARKGLDERIEELQAENKGLVDKAIGAIKAVINTIRELVGMLKNVLARVAGVVGDIVKNPVGFLSNLIDGVKGGILKFKDNIVDHLRKGLMSWLFGALAEGGVQLPDKFDVRGILQLLLSLFGLTWANIRNRLVKQVGEPAMTAMEKGVEIFQKLRSEGIAGLWQMLMEKLGDIKEMILEQVKDFVITKIITAGITWLIGLLNPAAAFIKACKLIYDVVMFFVNNGSRILKFVNTVIDSVADIVKGNVGGVVNKINDVLGQMVPIIIGFLASVIGLGGIGQKIREIVEKLQKPVNKALDFVIKTGLKLAGPVIRGLKSIGGKAKAKIAAGKAWVKGKAEAGKNWVKGKVAAGAAGLRGIRDRLLGITFRRTFEAGGEKHSVYTKKGKPGILYTASVEAPSAQAAPTPAVADLEAQFRTVMDNYVATASRADGDVAAAQQAAALKAQAEQILTQLVAATKAYVINHETTTGDPGHPADGIGRPGLHGEKPSSLRDQNRLLWLESEHIIPFAAGKSLWRALKLYLPWRGSHEDDAQTTIMIYERAARIKTPADNARSYSFQAILEASGMAEIIARGADRGELGMDTSEGERAWEAVKAHLEEIRKDAVARTVDAVQTENQMVEPGATRTNGQRRGNEAPTPGFNAIDGTSRTQMGNIIRLVYEEVMSRGAVRDKVERIRNRRPGGRS